MIIHYHDLGWGGNTFDVCSMIDVDDDLGWYYRS